MKILEYPLRKKFEKPMVNSDFKTLFILHFEQATIEEFHEFMALDMVEQLDCILGMILEQCPRNFMQKILWKWWIYFGNERLIRDGLKYGEWVQEFIQEIIAAKFRMYKSIFEEQKDEKEIDETKAIPYATTVANICEMFNINWPEELFKNYTIEQYYWMVDGMILRSNTYTEDGKATNERALTIKEARDMATKKVREGIENFRPKK